MYKNRALSQLEAIQSKTSALIKGVHSLPELPEDAHLWSTESELRIHIPYNWQVFGTLRRCLGNQWRFTSQFQGGEGDLIRKYSNGKIELFITLQLGKTGAACRREIIGIEEIPVYKVICNG